MHTKTILGVLLIGLLALGCGHQRIVGEGRDDGGERYSGDINVLPDFCHLMEISVPGFQCGGGGSYHPYGVFTRSIEIDGQLVTDEFEIQEGTWSERELADVIDPSAAMYDNGSSKMVCPNPNLTVCKWVWVSNWQEPGFGHWALECKTYGCLAWSPT